MRFHFGFVFALSIHIGFAQPGIITTYAGPGLPVNEESAVTQAISWPGSATPDGAGGFYVSSLFQNQVYRVDADGKINVIAGNGIWGYSGDGRPATSAQLRTPWGIAVDSAGNLFIADTNNNRIRKVTTAGIISTVAGNGLPYFSGDGGPATEASLNSGGGSAPSFGLALDSANNLYIAETNSNVIRRITPDGMIHTVVGNRMSVTDGIMSLGAFNTNTKGGYSGDGGIATAAQMSFTPDVAIDPAGNLFIADQLNHRIRKVSSILDCSSLAVSAGGVAACRTAGTDDETRAGYSNLTVDSGDTPYGTAVFSFKKDGVTITEAGVPATPPTKQARIFIDYRASVPAIPGQSSSGVIDTNTGLSVVNQGTAMAHVTYTLRNLNGVQIATGQGTISQGNHIACFINQLQQAAAPDFSLPMNFQANMQYGTLEIMSGVIFS
jgi:hypothetical protein